MKEVEIFSVDAFVGTDCSGNLAGVCMPKELLSESDFQGIAERFGAAETAFILRCPEKSLEIRWFTPEMEANLCGHATLAAAHWLWSLDQTSDAPIVFNSKSGPLSCTRNTEGQISLDFPKFEVHKTPPEAGLLDALAIDHSDFIGVSGDYLLVEMKDEESVRKASPDFSRLKKLRATGVFITARSKSSSYDFVSRCFFPKEGISEDPVTGSAHCSLGPYWAEKLGKKTLRALQASQEGGVLEIDIGDKRVRLSGYARTRRHSTVFKLEEKKVSLRPIL